MNKMLFVTKLIVDATKEEIYIYMSLDDFKKYAFTKKNNLFIPYEDKNLLDDLNNKDKVAYHQEIEEEIDEKKSEHIKRTKKKRMAKERVQKTLAGIGIAVTIFVSEPVIADGLSFSLKRISSFSHCTMIDEKTSNAEFMEQFAIAINKNQDYKEEERQVIIEGYKEYIDDWGYLLDEVDKEYILHMAETVNIARNSKFVHRGTDGAYWGFGSMHFSNDGRLNAIVHDSGHVFSDRGLLVGSINGYGLGYALNEGVNASVTDKYYMNDGYLSERIDALKLSLLTENEDFIKAYQKEGPEYFCRMVAERNPNINYTDVLKYLSMMDINFHLNTYEKIEGYKLPSSFFEEKEELYNKMFKAKYGYDFSESIIGNVEILTNNFLYDKIKCCKIDGFIKTYYLIPKELLSCKSSEFDYEKYFVEETKDFDYTSALQLLAKDTEVEKYNSWDEFCKSFASQYSTTEEEFNKVKSVFTQELGEENFDYYMDYVLDKVLKMNKSPDFTACYIKEIYNILKKQVDNPKEEILTVKNFDERFNVKVKDFLILNNINEVLELYNNSDIKFEEFDINDLNNCKLPEEYNIIYKTDNYVLLENGLFILKVAEKEGVWSAKYDQERNIVLQEASGEVELFEKYFESSDGKYYYTNMYSDFVTTEIDKDKISIYVASVVKTEDFNKQR